MSAAAERLAAFGLDLRFEDIPTAVVESAKLHFLDTLGCGLAAHALGVAGAPRRALLEAYGEGPATVLGARQTLPAPAAACANGALCHALDYDDTHSAAICNVGAIVGPAALALGEAASASGAELLAALVVGSETVSRLGLAAAPSFLVSGFHPTAVCGVFGAALAAARILRLGEREAVDALAIAGSTAAGIYEHLEDGSTTKTIHVGWAAQSGILAALFAAAGADGPATVLEGRYGVFQSHFRLPPETVLAQLGDLGERWETTQIAIRPYPACFMAQSSLDAAREAVGGRVFASEEIREIRVSIPAAGVPIVLEPRAEKNAPRNPYDAKFSLPYSVAAMLVHGRVDVSTYSDEAIRDPDVLAVAARVVYVERDFPTFPAAYPAAVTVDLVGGETFSAELEFHRGGPDRPMAAADILRKFRDNASLAVDDSAVVALENALLSLEDQPNLCAVALALRGLREEGQATAT